MKEQEDYYRHLFVARRGHPDIHSRTTMLDNVFEERALFVHHQTSYDRTLPQILTTWRSPKVGYSVVTREQFASNWQAFSKGMLDGLNWTNVCIAGGSVLACLVPGSFDAEEGKVRHVASKQTPFQGSDIDLFFYGMSDNQADAKVKEVYECLVANYHREVDVVRTRHAITFLFDYPVRHVQIVLRLYKSPAEVLMGFDIDACTVAFDGTDVWALPRARRALNKQMNVIDVSRRSLTYESRLFKYAKRGFAVAIPSLDLHRVDPRIFVDTSTHSRRGVHAPPSQQHGVVGLLRLDFKANNGSTIPFHMGSQRGRVPEDDLSSNTQEVVNIPGDYVPFIPWGPKWKVDSIRALLNAKDHSAFFSGARQTPVPHKHVCMNGIDNIINGTAHWCWHCQQKRGETPMKEARPRRGWRFQHQQQQQSPQKVEALDEVVEPEDDAEQQYVRGPIRWVSDNPGRQLLTGSFHPVDDEHWWDDVYLSDNDVAVNSLCTLAWTDSVPEVLDENSVRVIDLGDSVMKRPPMCWASQIGHLNALKHLIANGATPRSADSEQMSCLHAACILDNVKIADYLIAEGANLDAINIYGESVLMFALHIKAFDCARLLILRGANVKVMDPSSRTALFIAVEFADPSDDGAIVKLLLDAGADPAQPAFNSDGWGQKTAVTAEALAVSLQKSTIVAILKPVTPQDPTRLKGEQGGPYVPPAAQQHRRFGVPPPPPSADQIRQHLQAQLQNLTVQLGAQQQHIVTLAAAASNSALNQIQQVRLQQQLTHAQQQLASTTQLVAQLNTQFAMLPAGGDAVDASALQMLVEMGFSKKRSIKALRIYPDAESAAEWLLTNAESLSDDESPQHEQAPAKKAPSVVQVKPAREPTAIQGPTAAEAMFHPDRLQTEAPETGWGGRAYRRRMRALQQAAAIADMDDDESDSIAAFDAVAAGDAKQIAVLASRNLNEPDAAGVTALHVAAWRRLDAVQCVLQHHPELNVRDLAGQTPLHYAIKALMLNPSADQLAVIQELVAAGADVNAVDGFGRTALAVLLEDLVLLSAPNATAHRGFGYTYNTQETFSPFLRRAIAFLRESEAQLPRFIPLHLCSGCVVLCCNLAVRCTFRLSTAQSGLFCHEHMQSYQWYRRTSGV
eukprot:TRINITY_DN1146_c0_g1_i5.p1 TRINITY_DN1146_c0_g1~~TRINITY_DN1146_c0_g1_i5.p1  ORF type:complete len:1217 (+),score=226.35 TRINITY_DN1146_c0_g1_i5:261-3653(+)